MSGLVDVRRNQGRLREGESATIGGRMGLAILELVCIVLAVLLFGVPFWFVIVNSLKTRVEAAEMTIAFPEAIQFFENYAAVLREKDGMLIRAFFNSSVITIVSIAVLVVVCAMAGFVLQRRQGRATPIIDFLVLAGLMIPPAVVPTVWVLNHLGLFKTLPGLILVEVALSFPFSALLYKGFMASLPREIDESAVMDGCSGWRMFFQIILPLLKPVTATVIVLSSVNIFNDFANPLYFLPGAKNVTVQLTLYNFTSMYISSWNLLFADVVLISIPPLLIFIFFNKRIVAGMTAGAVKG